MRKKQNFSVTVDRIKKRIDDLRTNPSNVSTLIGATPGFLSDLYKERKKTISVTMLKKLAEALDCDSAYLLAEQDEPRIKKQITKITLSGSIISDVWMSPIRDVNKGLQIEYPLKNASADCKFYWLKAFQKKMNEFEAIVKTRNLKPSHGDLVVVERIKGDQIERSLRRITAESEGFKLEPFDERSIGQDIITDDNLKLPKNVSICGVVVFMNIVFNRNIL